MKVIVPVALKIRKIYFRGKIVIAQQLTGCNEQCKRKTKINPEVLNLHNWDDGNAVDRIRHKKGKT